VPSVSDAVPPTAAEIRVDDHDRSVVVVDGSGKIVARYPATTGSRHDPLPRGRWKVNGVFWNPQFHYNPRLFWDAGRGDSKATIQPGPNNPGRRRLDRSLQGALRNPRARPSPARSHGRNRTAAFA
jgi:hypothetical protein